MSDGPAIGGRGGEAAGGAPAWMVTFADLMTLILCFFVLMLSFSEMDIAKYKEVMGAMREAFGVQRVDSSFVATPKGESLLADAYTPGSRDLRLSVLDSMTQVVNADKRTKDSMEVVEEKRGLVLRMSGEVLFESARAEIRKDGTSLLDKIADLIIRYPHAVAVEGHCDYLPIETFRYPSNWELSAARAASVVRYFYQKRGIDPMRFAAVGYADSHPLRSNETAEGRAKNRRVEFVFLMDEDGLPTSGTARRSMDIPGETTDPVGSSNPELSPGAESVLPEFPIKRL